MANSSLSIFEYLCSVSVDALDMYMTGLVSCRKTTPSPFLEASHCIVCFLVLSNWVKTGSAMMTCLMASNAFCCSDSYAHTTQDFHSLLSGSEISDKTGLNDFR